jgi:tripartite-type tricarboxylate transporter receptor subunit TctC
MRFGKSIGISVAAFAAVLMAAGTASATYPERDIRLIVPFPAGGSTDIVGRIAAQAMSERLGRSIVVENRGGAGGTVGTQAASTMPADGYTLTVATTSTHVVGPLSHDTVKYKPLEGFSHIGMIGETPYVMVISPAVKAETVADVVKLAKEKPGALNFGSAGQGSTTHLAGEMFLAAAGVKMEHIPYKGNADATKAVMSNEVQVLFGSMPAVLSQIRAGTIKALAVGTTTRSPQLPDTPTMQEAGIQGYRASLWLGLAAPAGLPKDILDKLSSVLEDTVKDPKVADQLAKSGAEPTVMKPEEFRKLIADELKTYGKIVSSLKKGS